MSRVMKRTRSLAEKLPIRNKEPFSPHALPCATPSVALFTWRRNDTKGNKSAYSFAMPSDEYFAAKGSLKLKGVDDSGMKKWVDKGSGVTWLLFPNISMEGIVYWTNLFLLITPQL